MQLPEEEYRVFINDNSSAPMDAMGAGSMINFSNLEWEYLENSSFIKPVEQQQPDAPARDPTKEHGQCSEHEVELGRLLARIQELESERRDLLKVIDWQEKRCDRVERAYRTLSRQYGGPQQL